MHVPKLVCTSLVVMLIIAPHSQLAAQFSGARGGVSHVGGHGAAGGQFTPLSPEVAEGFITIEGKAELRIKPTEIRIVLAVTAEGKTSVECMTEIESSVAALKKGWQEMGVQMDEIVDDFISVLPRYEFELEEVRGKNVAVERKSGYLMQSNLHVSVKDDAEAMRAIKIAFANGVTDIIAFDYWSKEIDDAKSRARSHAIQAAQEKAKVMLAVFGDQKPPVINIQESTNAYYPQSMYVEFENDYGEQYSSNANWRDTPMIRTFRPKNTYYQGLNADGDVQAKELPMRSEITVVSAVRVYYQSPAANSKHRLDKDDD
ncbi:SIMPL domain-containing protein [Stieleria varia]|uniref:Oxidative stress defense protein n=1 Tax=Stieleria varia TaxID=2528005 RepID=A0A5C6AWZ7_9BACT|nr:SIMPL domain-containing protein [Stieleria varia]TWU04535.1 oxidative stress defense protein [Stieleria varia]